MPTPTLDCLINIRDPQKTGLLVNFNSEGVLTQGLGNLFRNDGEQLRLRFVEPSKSGVRFWDYVDVSTAAIRVAIGLADKTPSAGTFFLECGAALTNGLLTTGKRYFISAFNAGDNFSNVGAATNAAGVIFIASGTTPTVWTHASSLYEITADQAFNVAAADLQTALNATAAITAAGGVTVTLEETANYLVTFNTLAAQVLLGWNAANLTPTSVISVSRLVTGSAQAHEVQLVRLIQVPYAYAEPSTALDAASVALAELQAGATNKPEIFRATISESYDGVWTLTIGADTFVFPYNASQSAAQALIGTDWTVTHDDGSYIYVFTKAANGVFDYSTVSASPAGLFVAIGVSGSLALNTFGMFQAFAAAGTDTLALIYEIELQFPGETPRTVLHISVTLTRDVIDLATMIQTPLPSYYTAAECDARFAPLTLADQSNGKTYKLVFVNGLPSGQEQ